MGNSHSSSSKSPKSSGSPSTPSTPVEDSKFHIVLIYLNNDSTTREFVTETVKGIGSRCMERCIFVGLVPSASNMDQCSDVVKEYKLHNIIKHCLPGGSSFSIGKETESVSKLAKEATDKLKDNLSSMSLHLGESGPNRVDVQQVYTVNFPEILPGEIPMTPVEPDTELEDLGSLDMKGGAQSEYYQKYMKYKYKYMMAKKQLDNN